MGHCSNCGRPCTVCSQKADEFNLSMMPKNCRRLIPIALEKIGLNNDTDQSILLTKLKPYINKELAIESALRGFIAMKNPPKNVAYIVAIVKGNCIRKKEILDAIPPMAKGYEGYGD